ncbi:hypothetical protein SS50377_25723 [Spironucleus salmonicida]|uniref:Uncharacterized protein n=1 Tax=Spironucleus salmonicida TaxID=348837 RepID=V6LDX6_9EUKA|nr:hypothetical protein SS50377_25723 [Spironucleus salmonicida]|eukprot:EST42667.1 Hypothetical protein SS50377_17682 [Spironucleus salmonicida]
MDLTQIQTVVYKNMVTMLKQEPCALYSDNYEVKFTFQQLLTQQDKDNVISKFLQNNVSLSYYLFDQYEQNGFIFKFDYYFYTIINSIRKNLYIKDNQSINDIIDQAQKYCKDNATIYFQNKEQFVFQVIAELSRIKSYYIPMHYEYKKNMFNRFYGSIIQIKDQWYIVDMSKQYNQNPSILNSLKSEKQLLSKEEASNYLFEFAYEISSTPFNTCQISRSQILYNSISGYSITNSADESEASLLLKSLKPKIFTIKQKQPVLPEINYTPRQQCYDLLSKSEAYQTLKDQQFNFKQQDDENLLEILPDQSQILSTNLNTHYTNNLISCINNIEE